MANPNEPGDITLTPGDTNLGTIPDGTPTVVNFTVYSGGSGPATLTGITSSGPGTWVLSGLPAFPRLLNPGDSLSFVLTYTPAGSGLDSTNVSVAWRDSWGTETPASAAISAIAAPSAALVFVPTSLTFDTTVVHTSAPLLQVSIKNVDSINHNVVSLDPGTTGEFDFPTPPVMPFTLTPGQVSAPFNVRFIPIFIGVQADMLGVTGEYGLSSSTCSVQGLGLLLAPIAVCVNNNRQVVLGGYDASGLQGQPAALRLLPNDLNSDQLGLLEFNGTLWQGMGVEKTLFRLGIYYENLGQATLTITTKTFRPSQGADSAQTQSFVITFGTAAADESTRYAEVDCVSTGEIIELTLSRIASSGPVSIIAISPYFEARGEKVRNV